MTYTDEDDKSVLNCSLRDSSTAPDKVGWETLLSDGSFSPTSQTDDIKIGAVLEAFFGWYNYSYCFVLSSAEYFNYSQLN